MKNIHTDINEILQSGENCNHGTLLFLEEAKSPKRTDSLLTYCLQGLKDDTKVYMCGVGVSKLTAERKVLMAMNRSKPERRDEIRKNLPNFIIETSHPLNMLEKYIIPNLLDKNQNSIKNHLLVIDMDVTIYKDETLKRLNAYLQQHPTLTILVAFKLLSGNTATHNDLKGRHVEHITLD